MAERTRLIVFAKPPVPGLVKTRLSPPLSRAEAAAVHEASLKDVVAAARRTGFDVEIHFAGSDDDGGAFFAREFADVARRPQSGGDLGHRMSAAFEGAFARGETRVLLVGSDSPTLPREELDAAAREAVAGTVVLGPALDGGYYLVGMRAESWPAARRMFEGVRWSTDSVFTATVERLAAEGMGVHLLTPWYDIDHIEDLRIAALHAGRESHLGRLLDGWRLHACR